MPPDRHLGLVHGRAINSGLSLGADGDTKFEILSECHPITPFGDSLTACLAFADFFGLHGSAEEGRNETKYPENGKRKSESSRGR